MKKEYVVTAWTDKNELIRKTFKYRKAAEKFGCKMCEEYGHCTIHTYDENNKKIASEDF